MEGKNNLKGIFLQDKAAESLEASEMPPSGKATAAAASRGGTGVRALQREGSSDPFLKPIISQAHTRRRADPHPRYSLQGHLQVRDEDTGAALHLIGPFHSRETFWF